MANPNQQKQPLDPTVRGRMVTPEEVAYRDGYVQGQVREDRLHRQELRLRQEQQRAAANSNTTAGVFFGVLIFIVTALVGGTFWAIARNSSDTAPAPQSPETLDQSETPQSETTIIERTREIVPSVPEVVQPDIDITLPAPDPAESVPEAQSEPPADAVTPPEAEAPAEPQTAPQ